MKHTPGPWTTTKSCKSMSRNIDLWCADVDSKDLLIAPEVRGIGQAECEANTRLIAAAPDLLAAMPTVPHPGGRLVKVVAHYADGSTQTIDGDVVTAAIAKATGKAP